MSGMSANISADVLNMVRQWAAAGTDLNGIQKNLQTACGIHMTYMDVRFLLLDHGIEIATEPEAPAEQPETTEAAAEAPAPEAPGRPKVTLDDIQLPGTLISGKVEFPGGVRGGWMIDQMGRFGWSELSGQPSPDEMRDFERELTALISRG